MKRTGIRRKLLFLVVCLVIGTGIALTQVVTHHYGEALRKAALDDAEKTARLLALRAADLVLTNDLVGLHDLFSGEMKSNPSVRYIFLVRGGDVVAHTFAAGIPSGLLSANVTAGGEGRIERIVSVKDGSKYIDVAWPVFGGKAGVLRLGYGEAAYRQAVRHLETNIWLITLAVLCMALALSHLLIVRITRPITALADVVNNIDETELPEKVSVSGGREITQLVDGFNRLIVRLRDYTARLKENAAALEERNRALDRVHSQTRLSFEIAKAVGELPDLASVVAFLIGEIGKTVTCKNMAMLVLGGAGTGLYTCSRGSVNKTEDPGLVLNVVEMGNSICSPLFCPKAEFPFKVDGFEDAERIAVFPLFSQDGFIGSFCIGCPGDCRCLSNDLNVVTLILNLSLGAICRARDREDEIGELKLKLDRSLGYGGMIGKDPKMRTIYKLIEDVAPSDSTVLITGESGTGKEVAARAVHDASERRNGPFVVINCSAYPETLLESELFGYEKGAFTGATRQKPGRLEEAEGGTVFLDEIGEIPSTAQVKLLRVIQSRRFERLGGNRTLNLDVRLIAATNRNLLEEVKKGRFREDLFYRLNVIPIHMPPLRERKNDIPLLAHHFMDKFKLLHGKPSIDGIDADAMRILLGYNWPGNVRELENCIEHAVVLSKGEKITSSDLPQSIRTPAEQAPAIEHKETLWEIEKQHLIKVLESCNWNKTKAAAMLGIGRSSLYHKLKRFNIEDSAKN